MQRPLRLVLKPIQSDTKSMNLRYHGGMLACQVAGPSANFGASSFLSTVKRGSPNFQWRGPRLCSQRNCKPRLPVSSNLRPRQHTWWIEAAQWYSFRAQCPKQHSYPAPNTVSSWSLLRSLKTASKGNSASVAPGSPAHFFFGTIDSTTAHETKNYSSKKYSEPKHHGDLIKMWCLSFACCDYMMGLQCHQRHNCWWFSIQRKPMTYIIYIYNLMWIHQSSVITHHVTW